MEVKKREKLLEGRVEDRPYVTHAAHAVLIENSLTGSDFIESVFSFTGFK